MYATMSAQNARKSSAATGATTATKTAAAATAGPAMRFHGAGRRKSRSTNVPEDARIRNGANGHASCFVAHAKPRRAPAATPRPERSSRTTPRTIATNTTSFAPKIWGQ